MYQQDLVVGVSMTASSTTYNDGNWHHVAVTSNQTTYNTYVDGGSPITWNSYF